MRCLVMGIVNVTEDSFSDGGRYLDQDAAIAHAQQLLRDGADIIDVGGESTRPGATRVDAQVERDRVIPIVSQLVGEGMRVSVDTMRASVAEAAIEAGAHIINDVSGGLADPNMLAVLADAQQQVCLMHWKTATFGDAAGAAHDPDRAVADVLEQINRLVGRAVVGGIAPERIIIDPGLGFAKTAADNWALLAALPELVRTGFPVLVGASRKRFVTAVRTDRGLPADPDPATVATSALAASCGAWAVRVHDVAASRDAVDVAFAWQQAGQQAGQQTGQQAPRGEQ